MVIQIDGEKMGIEDITDVARNFTKVTLSSDVKEKMEKSRKIVDKIVAGKTIAYGIKTGFGELSHISISRNQIRELQKNLLRSHATGVGKPLPEDVVRAIMLLRANTLAKGFSGVRPILVETLIEMLNKSVHPIIPEKGSVGASGDLAPLAHMSLVLIGEGEANYKGKRINGMDAMKKANIKTLTLSSKDGIALINGTAVMTAIGALTVFDSECLVKNAEIACSMSLEALKGTDQVFDHRISNVRPHSGQKMCAENLRALLQKSEIVKSHKNCPKIQDPYTLRCIPQVIGASKDALSYVKNVINIEINSTTDNPLIFPNNNRGQIISGGNFHGQPIALAMDFLGIALAEIGNFSERRIARMLDQRLSGLPPFLTEKSGLHSGFMATQYTAASLVSENKGLAYPASVDSIPTSANQEDHVSMGTIASRKAMNILRNVEHIIAIELLCATQGIDFHKPLKAGLGAQTAYDFIRKHIPKLEKDRVMYPDMEKMVGFVRKGEILGIVERKVGKLK